jgi:hypothetical protein
MKKMLILLLSSILSSGVITFAQHESLEQPNQQLTTQTCNDTFTLNGPEITYIGETLNYSISPTIDPDLVFPIFYTLTLNNEDESKSLKTSRNSRLQISFENEGTTTLTASITKGDCEYQLEKKLTTYQKSLVYLGEDETAFQLNFDQNFAKDHTYFSKFLIERNATEENIKTLLRTKLRDISQSNTILIKYANFDHILHAYIELIQEGLIDGEEKNIFIISNRNQSFINRVLSLFIADL